MLNMNDIFDDDMPDIQPVEEQKVESGVFHPDAALRFAFVGCGAAGGRLANEFFLKGYKRSVAINTCSQDSKGLSDDLEFIDLGIGGAGKDPSRARECVSLQQNRVQLLRYFDEILSTDFDRVFVCAGLGGGTGSGIGPEMVKYLKEYISSKGINAKVGCILSLPQVAEGSRVAKNAIYAYAEFLRLGLSPMIVIDNARVAKIHNSTIARLFKDANNDAVKFLHTFNAMAAMSSFQVFDKADFTQLLDSGMITFGGSEVKEWRNGSDVVAKAIMATFKSATLADVDISNATQGACIIVAGENVLEKFTTEELMGGLDLLRNSSRHKDMMLHPAVYVNENAPDSLRVYVALGGLNPSKELFTQLARVGNVDLKNEDRLPSGAVIESKLARFLGVEE